MNNLVCVYLGLKGDIKNKKINNGMKNIRD